MKWILFSALCLLSLSSAHAQNDYLYLSENSEGYFGFVDKDDYVVVEHKYSYCFTDTLKHFAVVLIVSDSISGYYGIDRNDSILFKVVTTPSGPASLEGGLIQIVNGDDLIGFANEKGKVVIPPQFQCAGHFIDGREKVMVAYKCQRVPWPSNKEMVEEVSDEWFYIDKTGKRVD